MVIQILGNPKVPPVDVNLHHVLFVFGIILLCNQHSASRQGRFRILPIYWPRSHGANHLQSIKIEHLCGDLGKYSGQRITRRQAASGELSGRKRRADDQSASDDES